MLRLAFVPVVIFVAVIFGNVVIPVTLNVPATFTPVPVNETVFALPETEISTLQNKK